MSDWLPRLNAAFIDRCHVLGISGHEPRLTHVGAHQVPFAMRGTVALHRDALERNEPCALSVTDTLDEIWYETTDYATLCALRQLRHRHHALGASMLAVCPESREIIVQRRAAHLHVSPGVLHCVSGTFHPGVDASLAGTAHREFAEETGSQLGAERGCAGFALVRDDVWGFIELCMLGVPLTPAETAGLGDTVEGAIVRIAFGGIERSLTEDLWSDGGRVEVLAWLAHTASPLFDRALRALS